MKKLLYLVIKYNLSVLLEWAGIFRLLGCRGGFVADNWLELSKAKIQKELAIFILESLIEEGLSISAESSGLISGLNPSDMPT